MTKAEKKTEVHLSPKSLPVYKSKFFISFVVLSTLIAFLIGGFSLGKPKTTSPLSKPTDNTKLTWKTYTMPTEKLTFEYPTNWELKAKVHPAGELPYSSVQSDEVYLLSPNNFALGFDTGSFGLGGGCPESCQKNNRPNILLGTLNFYTQPLYIFTHGVINGADYEKATKLSVTTENNCFDNVCYGFVGKNSEGIMSVFGGYLSDRDLNIQHFPQKVTYEQDDKFAASQDVKTAVQILKSAHY